MITVHHLENSRSQRVLWLLEELGLSYRIEHYARNKATMLAPPELRAVHPLGKSPVITDDAADGGQGRTIAETGAIVEYLVEKGGGRCSPTPRTKRFTWPRRPTAVLDLPRIAKPYCAAAISSTMPRVR